MILSGTVRSWLERHEAERVAWSTPGVTKVEDRIVVAHPLASTWSQLANLACDLDSDQRSVRFLLLSSPPDHAVRATCRPDYVIGLNPSALQETIMNQLIRAGAFTVAIFSSNGFATAQRAPGIAQADLTPSQERMVSQGLASSPSQPAPTGAQPQVGNRIPDSMSAQALPNNVTDQVPDAKGLLFVKLPDRIVLIDPETKLVTEILMGATTTGSSPASSSPPSR